MTERKENKMNFIVNEYQTTNGQTLIVPAAVFSNQNEAEADFHTKASAAAISRVDVHTVTIHTEDGRQVRTPECYRHNIQEE